MWTRTATNGILPRHTCSARCRGTASIQDLAVAVGAVPVSINQQVVSNTVCPRHAEIARDARWPVDMWTTQGRCPQTHRPNNNRNQLQFDEFEKQPTGPEGSKPTWLQGGQQTHYTSFTRILKTIHRLMTNSNLVGCKTGKSAG